MRDMRKNSRTGCVASAVESRILVIETEADTQHQIVRITEILQIVAHMQVGAAGKFRFQRQHLVDTFVVAATMQNVGTDTIPWKCGIKNRFPITCNMRANAL